MNSGQFVVLRPAAVRYQLVQPRSHTEPVIRSCTQPVNCRCTSGRTSTAPPPRRASQPTAHRTYHVSRVPTFNRKARVVADWTMALLFRREVISLGQLQDPRREFVFAANTGRPGQLPPPQAPSPADEIASA